MLRAVTENVLLEIQKTFDFFKATAASDRIDRDHAERRRVARRRLRRGARTSASAAPVEPFDPFRQIAFDAEQARASSAEEVAPTAAVAVGLALRRAGDR